MLPVAFEVQAGHGEAAGNWRIDVFRLICICHLSSSRSCSEVSSSSRASAFQQKTTPLQRGRYGLACHVMHVNEPIKGTPFASVFGSQCEPTKVHAARFVVSETAGGGEVLFELFKVWKFISIQQSHHSSHEWIVF